jgi:hypothetical protein
MGLSIMTRVLCALLIALSALSLGCTRRQVYDSAAGWRQNECQKLIDQEERTTCMESAARDYEAYRKERTSPVTR